MSPPGKPQKPAGPDQVKPVKTPPGAQKVEQYAKKIGKREIKGSRFMTKRGTKVQVEVTVN